MAVAPAAALPVTTVVPSVVYSAVSPYPYYGPYGYVGPVVPQVGVVIGGGYRRRGF